MSMHETLYCSRFETVGFPGTCKKIVLRPARLLDTQTPHNLLKFLCHALIMSLFSRCNRNIPLNLRHAAYVVQIQNSQLHLLRQYAAKAESTTNAELASFAYCVKQVL